MQLDASTRFAVTDITGVGCWQRFAWPPHSHVTPGSFFPGFDTMTTSFFVQVSENVRTIIQGVLFGHEFSWETVLVVTTIVVVVAVIYVFTKD